MVQSLRQQCPQRTVVGDKVTSFVWVRCSRSALSRPGIPRALRTGQVGQPPDSPSIGPPSPTAGKQSHHYSRKATRQPPPSSWPKSSSLRKESGLATRASSKFLYGAKVVRPVATGVTVDFHHRHQSRPNLAALRYQRPDQHHVNLRVDSRKLRRTLDSVSAAVTAAAGTPIKGT